MKKALCVILCLCLLVWALPGFAESIPIFLDGEPFVARDVDGDEVYPIIIDGTTYLPVRALGEALGLTVTWENGAVYLTSQPEPIVIGTHAGMEDDPFWTDMFTGEYYHDENVRRAAETAIEKVRAELGVDIEWKQYDEDLQLLLLKSVLAGDPFCDLAVLWDGVQGNILSQNVLQPLDPYVDKVFFGENEAEYGWLLQGKTFGSYYLLNRDFMFTHTWPLVYNINYIEAVPELKEADGTTLYPAELYERGEWTWSRFEDYLSKINNYYQDKMMFNGLSFGTIAPYDTNYSYAAIAAAASTGTTLFDGESVNADSREVKEAVEYLDRMIDSGLISCSSVSDRSIDSGWIAGSVKFMNGGTVFTNCAQWQMDNVGEALSDMGMSIGVIPFPKPDGKEDYGILSSSGDSVGLLRGIDSRRSELALEAYVMYKTEFYKAMAGVNSMAEYIDAWGPVDAAARGIDILHPEIGDANLRIFKEMAAAPINDYSESIGMFWTWTDLVGKSIYGYNGAPEYSAMLHSHRNETSNIYTRIEGIAENLKSETAIDGIVPYVGLSENIELASGTDPASIDWSEYFYASDNVDGDYELKTENGGILIRGEGYHREEAFETGRFEVDHSAVDFGSSGSYIIQVTIIDKAGNVGEWEFEVIIK